MDEPSPVYPGHLSNGASAAAPSPVSGNHLHNQASPPSSALVNQNTSLETQPLGNSTPQWQRPTFSPVSSVSRNPTPLAFTDSAAFDQTASAPESHTSRTSNEISFFLRGKLHRIDMDGNSEPVEGCTCSLCKRSNHLDDKVGSIPSQGQMTDPMNVYVDGLCEPCVPGDEEGARSGSSSGQGTPFGSSSEQRDGLTEPATVEPQPVEPQSSPSVEATFSKKDSQQLWSPDTEARSVANSSIKIPLSLFYAALPTSTEAISIIEGLPRSHPGQQADPALPAQSYGYQLIFHVEDSSESLVISGRFPTEALGRFLHTYLALVAPIRVGPVSEALDAIPKFPSETLTEKYLKVLTEVLESGSNKPKERALVCAYLSVIARHLHLEELQDFAEEGVHKELRQSATRTQGWVWFDPKKRQYWDGAVEYDDNVDIGVDGIIDLVRCILANPGTPTSQEELSHVSISYDDMDETGLGYCMVMKSPAAYYKNNTTRNTDTHAFASLKQKYERDYLSELVKKFLAEKMISYRHHPDIQNLFTEIPRLAIELVFQHPLPPGASTRFDNKGRCVPSIRQLISDWNSADDWHGKIDVEEIGLCPACFEKLDYIRDVEGCTCGNKKDPGEECENCCEYVMPSESEYDPDDDDYEDDVGGDYPEDDSDDNRDLEEVEKERSLWPFKYSETFGMGCPDGSYLLPQDDGAVEVKPTEQENIEAAQPHREVVSEGQFEGPRPAEKEMVDDGHLVTRDGSCEASCG
ncbi:hypothetical protein BJ508DRAFT_305645 [Ascobolus immersus RN42]|uniref:Uncharacterized protein n=1 Tax=Ascobolus immersus RN42 TaxID=1160509 RepID=A0A3N4IAL1_ASCIM|nr:hypothetical protein BJ508DRAFT_305645 [Ascobolus immersus RN42]